MSESDRSGILDKAAVEIASFPFRAKIVITELLNIGSGNHKDEWIRVKREENAGYSEFVPVPMTSGIDVNGFLMRADQAEMADGWRLLAGALTLDNKIESAAFLISPDLKVVGNLVLDEIPIGEFEPRPNHRKKRPRSGGSQRRLSEFCLRWWHIVAVYSRVRRMSVVDRW